MLARYMVGALGLDFDRDFQGHLLERAADGPAMVLDSRVAALWGGGVGWPGFTSVFKGPTGARFIAPTSDEVKRITAKYGFIKPVTLPAGSYPGQDSAVSTIGSWSFVLTRRGLPEEQAYRLARALHRSEAALGNRIPQARESTLANTVAAAPSLDLIHPGVLKYFREIGLVR